MEEKKWENPSIRVVWEDYPENITQEKTKDIRQYFAKKYSSSNVQVITKSRSNFDSNSTKILQTIDVSSNILDANYQNNLIKKMLEANNNIDCYDKVMEINKIVENKLLLESPETTQFNKWYIKNIKFSNFLSFGDNQVLDFDKLNGITIVESIPQNTGGKTTLTIDLLLFLFFNTTTKSSKAEDVFNKFTNKDRVSVVGEILIDGEEYIISRTLDRKLNKSDEWKIKTELSFDKKLKNGELQNLKGEQRRETEVFIKNTIGNIDDFLATILTTGNNLEDLLESKPTARGQLLSRFLGLEHLKKKEDLAKEVYSDFTKRMYSNLYNPEKLKKENEDLTQAIEEFKENLSELNIELVDIDERISKGNEYKQTLFGSRYNDINKELSIINKEELENEISSTKEKADNALGLFNAINITKPIELYDEVEHDRLKETIMDYKLKRELLRNKIDDVKKMISTYGNGISCEHCGLNLIDAKFTKEKIANLSSLEAEFNSINNDILKLEDEEKSKVSIKKEYDTFEKNKLVKQKNHLTYESLSIKHTSLIEKLKNYLDVQIKINKNIEIDKLLIKANKKIDELVFDKNKINREITSIDVQSSNFQDKKEKNLEIIQNIYKEQNEERYYKLYVDIFGKNGISKMIMKTMLPFINSELQRLLDTVCYFSLDVRMSDKNEVEFLMIDNNTGIEKLMTTGSGYEKTVASLALRAVLSKICSLPKPNIWVADEVFGKVSNENLDMLSDFFVRLKSYFEKILVISHNPLINNWANSSVIVEKKNNISKIIK
jgi:DNA repair exonuclease SbcCD ATPase subunit